MSEQLRDRLSSPLASLARSSAVGFVIVGLLCTCGSPPGDRAPSPRTARAILAADEPRAPSSQSAAEPAYDARFATMPCWFHVASDREIDCGELTVPENWSKPESKLIHLPVVIFRATAAPKEPIVFVNGGPGAPSRVHTADEIQSWLGLLWNQRWTQRRDFIVIGQRGTNWSDSNLSCPALSKLWQRLPGIGQSAERWRTEVEGATVACARRLAIGHDLSGYNTTQSARDIAALKQALEVDDWSVYAVSYGTRFALSLMKNHPSGLRSVVLDSAYPPGMTDLVSVTPTAFLENLSRVFDACVLDLMCRQIYPDLDVSFETAIHRLRSAPAIIVDSTAADAPFLGPSGLVDALFNLMYSSDTIGLIPEVIHGFAKYSEPYLNEWAGELLGGDNAEPLAEGAFMAITCNDGDELPAFESRARAASAHPLLREWILDQEYVLPCADWPVAAIPVEDKLRVTSAIPTLLLAGAFDPVTPSIYAEFAAATLTRAELFNFPASSHGVLGNDECAAEIIEAFLDDPKTQPAPTCLNAEQPIDFSSSFQMHAWSLVGRGEHTEAEQLLRQTLAYQEERLRPDHPGIGVTLSSLGELYYEQGRLADAEGTFIRALAIKGKAYGPDSLEAGESAGRLAVVYHDQGKNEEATSLYQRTLRILEREYGQEHADVLFYRNRYDELVSRSAPDGNR